jgi:hypothetical protein
MSWQGDGASGEQQGDDAETMSRIGVDHGNLTPSTHPRAIKKRGQFKTDTIIDMQRSTYFQPYLF